MHSSRELRSSSFQIAVEGRRVGLQELFPSFGEHDRLGVVLSRPCGAVGASALITATITAFYDLQRTRGSDFRIYPDYYLFHVGDPLGDHGRLDVWPRRKEVVVPAEPDGILAAINDRAITRLVVEDGAPGDHAYAPDELASARARIATCLAYSASGRVIDADVRIAGNAVTEGYVADVLDPERRLARLADEAPLARLIAARAGEVAVEDRRRIAREREAVIEDGRPVETYRRVGLDEALALLSASSRPTQAELVGAG
jgi:hypothetical protein